MPKTKEITFKCANVKVEPDNYKIMIVTVERPDMDEIFEEAEGEDIRSFIADRYDPEDIFSDKDLASWAEENGYIKQ